MTNIRGAAKPVEGLKTAFCNIYPELRQDEAFQVVDETGMVWRYLVDKKYCTSLELAARDLAHYLGVEYQHYLAVEDAELLHRFPRKLAISLYALPIKIKANRTVVATANPFDTAIEEHIRFSTGLVPEIRVAPADDIRQAIFESYEQDRHHGAFNTVKLESKGVSENKEPGEHDTIRLAQSLLRQSLAMKASDLHVQPFSGSYVVRVRVDGIMHQISLLPYGRAESLVRFFMAHSGMDPTNQRIIQEDSLTLSFDNNHFDLRLSVVPANGGVRLVIRFLNQNRIYRLASLGFSAREVSLLKTMTREGSGMVLLTGPTGSGKTSTLYAFLNELNREYVNIMTIEDPIEYRFSGISQVEVNSKAGLTFPKVLKSILRQDPDVVLVGEIRDEETARISAQAAMTGHLVLTTLHANSAFGVVPRLYDLGVPVSIMSQALTGVVSQRLVRKLCPLCKVDIQGELSPHEQLFYDITGQEIAGARPTGCKQCNYTGYVDRIPITEILIPDYRIFSKYHESDIYDVDSLRQISETYSSMVSSAVERIVAAETTVEEVERVVGRQFWISLAHEYDYPDLNLSELTRRALVLHRQTGILFVGPSEKSMQPLADALSQSWLKVYFCSGIDESIELINSNPSIRYVVLDVDEKNTADELEFIELCEQRFLLSKLRFLFLLQSDVKEVRDKIESLKLSAEFQYKPVQADAIIAWLAAL